MPSVTPQGAAELDAFTASKVSSGTVPLLYSGLASKDGIFYWSKAGKRLRGSDAEVQDDTMLQLFSMTKLVTTTACLQLWSRGEVDFDDPALIEKHLPELAAQPILVSVSDDGQIVTKQRTRPLTLRHLVTHTSGLAYNFISPELAKWEQATKAPSWAAPRAPVESLVQPLLFEPGTRYMYSIGLDWAGILVERLTGQSLEDYFHEHIFGPCGISRQEMTFLPTEDVKARLASMWGRDGEGNIVPSDGLRAVQNWTPEDITLRLGGAGLLGTARAYLVFLHHLLACKDADGIVSRAAYDLLFTNALPPRGSEFAEQVYKDLGAMAVFEGVSVPEFASGKSTSHSLGLMLFDTDSPLGRKAGSGFWSGAAKTRFWIDPTTGIAAFCGTQILEFDWKPFAKVVDEFEQIVYRVLQ